jgi:CRISPR system Cascade subunit CasC
MTMDRFLQLHLLTAYPPANLNRDDLGRPKTAVFGGRTRLRISSQSLKRAWRTSEVFQESLAGHVGIRTKRKGKEIFEKLVAGGVNDRDAASWARLIAGRFGQLETPESQFKKVLGKLGEIDVDELVQIKQLAHFGPSELHAIDELVENMVSRREGPTDEELNILHKSSGGVDIGLFGRMLTKSDPKPGKKEGEAIVEFSVEAAAQVAHAISVNAVQVEDDFFTAVDDLNPGDEDMGAGHMGEAEFGAGVFYLYICIDRALLVENLGGDQGLAGRVIRALVEAAATVAPRGKQATFASRARASFILAEKGNQQPRSLAVAFLDPVRTNPMLEEAVERIENTAEKMDRVYGPCASDRVRINVITGEGSINTLIKFAGE